MKWFKTKKDKRIEQLEHELACMAFKTPRIIETQKNVQTYVTCYRLPRYDAGVPMEHIRHVLANQLSETIFEKMNLDIEDVDGEGVIKAYINIVE